MGPSRWQPGAGRYPLQQHHGEEIEKKAKAAEEEEAEEEEEGSQGGDLVVEGVFVDDELYLVDKAKGLVYAGLRDDDGELVPR